MRFIKGEKVCLYFQLNYVKENLERRRWFFENKKKYVDSLIDFIEELDDYALKENGELVDALGISWETYKNDYYKVREQRPINFFVLNLRQLK